MKNEGSMGMIHHTMNPSIEVGDYRSGEEQPIAVSCTCGWVRRFHRIDASGASDMNEANRLWTEHMERLNADPPV